MSADFARRYGISPKFGTRIRQIDGAVTGRLFFVARLSLERVTGIELGSQTRREFVPTNLLYFIGNRWVRARR